MQTHHARVSEVLTEQVLEPQAPAGRGAGWLSGAVVIALFSLVVVTAWVDPEKVWLGSQTVERTLAHRMAMGESTGVLHPRRLDMRIVQDAYVDEASQAPTVLVLGPSSMRAINTELFEADRVYNAHAPGMQLEDLLWLTERYHGRGHLPQRLVLGLSPWALLGDEDMSWRLASWRRYADGVASMRDRLGEVSSVDRWALGWSALAARWGSWFQPTRMREAVVSPMAHEAALLEPAMPQLERLVRADGSHWVEEQLRHRPADEVESEALSPEMLGGIEALLAGLPERIEALEPSRLQVFEAYVDWLGQQGVTVEIVLPPLHPAVYEHVHERFGMVDSMEAYLRRVAGERELQVLGSYNPGTVGCTAPMFIDAFHFDRPCAFVMFSPW